MLLSQPTGVCRIGCLASTRNFFTTLVPGSGRFQLTNLPVRIWVRVIARVRVSVTVMVRVSNVLGSG